ncbi:MAG: MBL fold metallo-hydrolase [Patescibacteria group bacterium]
MIITWHGYSCFKIQEKTRDAEVTLLTDPFESDGDLKLPRSLAADIVTVSHDHAHHNNLGAVSGEPFVIDGPGEYEVKGMFVTGVSTFHDMVEGKEKGLNTMYYITAGGIHAVHLGDLKHPLEDRHMEEFHNIDILFVPVGGGDVLNAKQAVEIVGQLEPRIIIPMHYRTPGMKDLDGVDAFFKAMGVSKPEPLPKFKITDKDLPQEKTQIVLLDLA